MLSRFDGSRVGTIADLSGGEQPAVSRVIDQMERDGLVNRRPALDDSRAVQVWISPRGREMLEDLMPHAEDFVSRMVRTLSDEEIKKMNSMLERVFSDLQERDT